MNKPKLTPEERQQAAAHVLYWIEEWNDGRIDNDKLHYVLRIFRPLLTEDQTAALLAHIMNEEHINYFAK